MASYCWECVAVKHKDRLSCEWSMKWIWRDLILSCMLSFAPFVFCKEELVWGHYQKFVYLSGYLRQMLSTPQPYPATQPSIHCINTMIVEDSSHYSQSSSAHLSSNNVPLTFWSDSFLISFTKQHNNSVWLTSQGNNPRQSRSGHDGSYQANR